jgi:hypothetical protein
MTPYSSCLLFQRQAPFHKASGFPWFLSLSHILSLGTVLSSILPGSLIATLGCKVPRRRLLDTSSWITSLTQTFSLPSCEPCSSCDQETSLPGWRHRSPHFWSKKLCSQYISWFTFPQPLSSTTPPGSLQRSYPPSNIWVLSPAPLKLSVTSLPPPNCLATSSSPATCYVLTWVQRPLTLIATHREPGRNVISIKSKRFTAKENDANTLLSLWEKG